MPWSVFISFFTTHQCDAYYLAPAFDGMISFADYLPYFLKTIVIEFPIYYLLFKNFQSFKKLLVINLVLNLATHPIVFYVISYICFRLDLSYLHYLISAEIFAPVVEALILIYVFKIPISKAWVASILANLMSWSIGVWL
jgi:hypothetical protein